MEKQNRTRNIQMLFCVTADEKLLIQEKMRLLRMDNMQKYICAMAVDGIAARQRLQFLCSRVITIRKIYNDNYLTNIAIGSIMTMRNKIVKKEI